MNLRKIWNLAGFFSAFVFFSMNLQAQFSEMAGVSISDTRNNHLLSNEKPIFNWQFGILYRGLFIKNTPKYSWETGLLINQKGYQQDLNRNYRIQLNYISLPAVLNFNPRPWWAVYSGLEFSRLFHTNLTKGLSTYRKFDLGVILGVTFFDNSRFGIFVRGVYGLVPTLDYVKFDRLGNITGEIHDLKNRCISIGLKVKLYDFENDK